MPRVASPSTEWMPRSQPVKSLAKLNGQQICKFVQLILGVLGQLGSLGQILTDKSVGVLVGSTLPRAVRVSKVNSYPPSSE